MKSAEFRVPLAVAGRLARAEMKDRATRGGVSTSKRIVDSTHKGWGFYHSAKVLSTQLQNSALAKRPAIHVQHSALSTQYGKTSL
ncbi:hypothetical protein [Nostoc sp.]|uniref:hypothetical protein n=1 Tax=Nostoc sp. TaxID=1180 RepID=UPI002FF263A1